MIVELSILVWNVHGIPMIGPKPADVAEFIFQHRADITMLQEVWTKRMARHVTPQFDFSEQYLDGGLVTNVKYNQPEIIHSSELRFKHTAWSKLDWLVNKGATFTVNSDFIMFINTHLDSGRDNHSTVVRAQQLDEILRVINKHNGPVVMVGDLNLKPSKYKEDAMVLDSFLKASGLRVALAGREEKDYILLKGDIHLKSPVSYFNMISDHDALGGVLVYESYEDQISKE